MKVLVSGSRGFIGSALIEKLQSQGHQISRLVRKSSVKEMDDFVWSYEDGYVDKLAFKNCDAVVHLAAENVAGRWPKRKCIRFAKAASRVQRLFVTQSPSLKTSPPSMSVPRESVIMETAVMR